MPEVRAPAYEWSPIPSALTPHHENATTMPQTTVAIETPKDFRNPPIRPWSVAICTRQIINAPFSFGSHPQNRPHDSFAQMPPRIVPTIENQSPKQRTP